MNSNDLAAYYTARAPEYDQVYAKAERQADLAQLRRVVKSCLAGRDVLELACGTGYWTAVYTPVAASVVATDLSPELLARARERIEFAERVEFVVADALAPAGIAGRFDACFAGFWWSHVPRSALARFLSALHCRLPQGALVMFVDNRFVERSSTPLARLDADGNSYQRRSLADGRTFDVLKNFPSAREVLKAIDGAGGTGTEIVELPYYWYATYVVGPVQG